MEGPDHRQVRTGGDRDRRDDGVVMESARAGEGSVHQEVLVRVHPTLRVHRMVERHQLGNLDI